MSPEGCAFHAIQALIEPLSVGDMVWDLRGAKVLQKIKQALAMLGEQNYENIGFKLWRKSKATEMARQGHSLGEVLTAGEWKSRAILNYVQESAIDSAALLSETLNLSEDEADED